MSDTWVTVARYADLGQAMLAKHLLESHGISTNLPDEDFTAIYGDAARIMMEGIALNVPQDRAAEADKILSGALYEEFDLDVDAGDGKPQ